MGLPVRKRDVNRQLYYSGRYQNRGSADSPAWSLSDTTSSTAGSHEGRAANVIPFPSSPQPTEFLEPDPKSFAARDLPPTTPESADVPQTPRPVGLPAATLPGLKSWQKAARRRWYKAGCRGVVEAVTGSGKTVLGAAIITDELRDGRKILVIVPTIVLAHQWRDAIVKWVPGASVGILGDGHTRVPRESNVIVAIKNSAANKADSLTFVNTVIADECHNYAAAVVRRALIPTADHRLGLTATFERLDNGIREVLRPYFGDTVYKCGFDKAFQDGLLAPARIALVGVPFTSGEQSDYDDAHELMSKNRRSLIGRFGVPAKPFGVFMMTIGRMAKDPTDPGHKSARAYLKARNRTRDLLASAEAKTDFMLSLGPLLEQSAGALLFCERIAAADHACSTMKRLGLQSASFHSQVPPHERTAALRRLGHGQLDVLCTAKALDEGVDVPDTDVGLVAAGTQQRRQMIQRLGRVLRKKPDGRAARFVIAYVTGAREEDPAQGANESFLKEIDDIVGEHKIFTATQIDDIIAFLTQPHAHETNRGKTKSRPAKSKPPAAPVTIPEPPPRSDSDSRRAQYGARLLRGFDSALEHVIALARDDQVKGDDLTLPGILIANAALHQATESEQGVPRISALPDCSELVSDLDYEDITAVNRICQALTNARVTPRIADLWAHLFLEVFDANA